ncbi:MAG: hypothetical protein Q9190_003865 [Brigantiaea leucoxantha]
MLTTATAPLFFSPSTIHAATTLPLTHQHIRPSTPLANPIHPIFSSRNFPTISAALYTFLSPSLRLASRFLTSPATLPWWVPLFLGTCLPSHKHKGELTLSHPTASSQNLLLCQKFLLLHAENVVFAFRPEDRAFASTYVEASTGKRVIFLSTPHLLFLTSGRYAAASRAQRQTFQVHVALNLVHEVAHSVRSGPEPYYRDEDPLRELGASWESWTFCGGKIQPIGLNAECRMGLMWFRWVDEETLTREVESEGARFWAVDMVWVEGICGEELWRQAEEEGKKLLDVKIFIDRGAILPYGEGV